MELTIREALNAALHECMARDADVVVLGEDIGAYGGPFQVTRGLVDVFGRDRVMDTPISESGFCGAAAGMALGGLRPVVEVMLSDFLLVCADALGNQVAKLPVMTGGQMDRNPITVRTSGGSYRGSGPQSGEMFEALFAHLPGWKIVAPSNPADAKGLLVSAIEDDSPVLFVEHMLLYAVKGDVPDEAEPVPIGRATVAKAGTDVTLVSYSYLLTKALDVAARLADEGISVEVIDLRTLVPLDMATVKASVLKTGRIVIAHEAHARCGIGAEVAALLAQDDDVMATLAAPIRRVAARDVPIGAGQAIESWCLPTEADLEAAIRDLARRHAMASGPQR